MSRNTTLLQLFNQSGKRLHRLILRLTLNEHVAEEMIQDLFARLCRHENPATIKNIEAYAVRCAMNLALSWRRKQKHNSVPVSDDLVDNKTPLPIYRLIHDEQLEQILDAVEQLQGQTRECFVLHYIEQMDYLEIANQTEKTAQQVRGLCAKGTGKIRRILNQKNALIEYKEAINE